MSSNSTDSANPLASIFPRIPVDNTLGAWIVGTSFSLLLNGMLIIQAFQYYINFPRDRTILKFWVAIVLLLETFVSVLIVHTSYFYLVTQYWDPIYFFTERIVWSLNVLPIFASIAAFLSQCFFARRLWMIAPKFRFVVGIGILLIFGNVVCFTAFSVLMFRSTGLLESLKFSWLATLGSAIQMTGDLTISATLIYVLRTSRTGIHQTDSVVGRIIIYSVSTGVVTCLVHIFNLVFSAKEPDNFIYAAFSCVLTKLYSNAFLVALNSRRTLGIMDSDHASPASTSLAAARGRGPAFNSPLRTPNAHAHAHAHPTTLELKVVAVSETAMDNDNSSLYGDGSQHAAYKRGSAHSARSIDVTTP